MKLSNIVKQAGSVYHPGPGRSPWPWPNIEYSSTPPPALCPTVYVLPQQSMSSMHALWRSCMLPMDGLRLVVSCHVVSCRPTCTKCQSEQEKSPRNAKKNFLPAVPLCGPVRPPFLHYSLPYLNKVTIKKHNDGINPLGYAGRYILR